jgi:iron complex outermembrane receptor protein
MNGMVAGWRAAESGRTKCLQRVTLALLMSTVSHACFAQSATPGATITLDTITVEDQRPTPARGPARAGAAGQAAPAPAAPAAPAAATVAERFQALPGGVTLVRQQDFPDTANLTVARALESAPGVVVQSFFGGNDQPRIQIRGSGLQQNPVERGILVLQNGLPINRADGSYIVGFANPQQAEAIEVYRGYMANRLGATVLGGALNFVSPTGSSQPGVRLSVSGGSFGQINAGAQAGFRKDNVDGMIQFDSMNRDGFRVYNDSERHAFNANVGIKHSENVSTRVFLGYTDLKFDVAGPLPKAAMYADPRQVHTGPIPVGGVGTVPGPNVPRDKPMRDASQFLAGSRTTATFGAHLIDVAAGYTYTDDTFRFPVSSGIRTTEGGDFTGLMRYAYNPAAAVLPLFEATGQYVIGSADRGNYINLRGTTGAKFGESELDASTLSLFAGFNIPLWENVTLSPAISYSRATRDNHDTYNLATRPWIMFSGMNPNQVPPPPNGSGDVPTQSTSYARSYEGWNPSLALSYRPDNVQTYFAAVSRSFEPPTHDDLLATVYGTPNASPGACVNPGATPPCSTKGPAFSTPNLKAQTATTVEGGWRGRTQQFSWDAVVYYSWVDDELLSLRDAAGASLGAINADKTTHFGVELGVGAMLTDKLLARVVYTYQDFRFDGDPTYGNNRLAGAPSHLVNAMLQYQATDKWKLQGSVRWVPQKTPVDNANLLFADSYVVVDLRSEYKVSDNISIFGEVTNVFDEVYASSTLVVDRSPRPDQAAFLPGDGRGYFGGVKARF